MRKKGKRQKGFTGTKSVLIWSGITVLFIVVLSLGYLLYGDLVSEKVRKHRPVTVPGKAKQYSVHKRKIAIIIDDVGYDLWPVEEIIKMSAPITLSILPHCPYSTESAERAHRAGREILLHLPMEPSDYPEKNPGDGALFVSMSDGDIRYQLDANFKSVPYVSGVNNHMGSRFMEDEKKLEVVLKVLREKKLFFIDSYTTKNTKGEKVARKVGVPFVGRDVFIDNNSDFVDTMEIMEKMIDKRGNWQTLVIIGHTYESTIQALKKAIPLFKASGIEIVPPSELTGQTTTG
ncbi:MAG: divergent polysaccharide deacetylase family protein [Deltaproteobacteria bacterium]|nr:divergent polysaccharide deacetylase family protein [Deltaproteobacteria bacterium]